MTIDYRITESGDTRVTEASDFRIPEEAYGEASLAGSGVATYDGYLIAEAVLALSGSGSMLSDADAVLAGASLVAGAGATAADGILIFGASFGGQEQGGQLIEKIRLTEAGDTRITESGDTRITSAIDETIAHGSLYAGPLKIDFIKEMYLNRSDVWTYTIPYVKSNGEWQAPLAVYKNISGSWKRVH